MRNFQTIRHGRRGMMLVWGVVLLTLLFTLGLITVDVGAIYHARGKLQASVDNAARYGATGLRNGNIGQAKQRIRTALADNPIGGVTPNAADANIQFGLWDPETRALIPVEAGEERSATAVRVTATMTKQNGNGLISFFGSFLGYDSYDVTRSATAAIGQPLSIQVDAKASPYLAGMGPESGAGNGDIPFTAATRLSDPPTHSTYADCAPVEVTYPVQPGQILFFRDVQGETGDHNSGLTYGLEGNLSRPDMRQDPINGFDTTVAPLNSLMGVFLTDQAPTATPDVAGLDYSSESAREKFVHRPRNKQVFFIGDGVRNSNSRLQRFVVPDGATRLFLGVSDEYGFWWDNFGDYRTTMFTGDVQIVD